MISNNLPSNSRVWVYQSVKKFSNDELGVITTKLKTFVAQWTSHKEGVVGDGAVLYNRFIVLMADEEQTSLGGCSIDSSVHFIKGLEKEFSTNFFDRWNIAYKKDNEVLSCSITEFGKLVETKEVEDDTIVFNNLVQTKKDFEDKWEVPYKNSWLKNVEMAHTSFGSIL